MLLKIRELNFAVTAREDATHFSVRPGVSLPIALLSGWAGGGLMDAAVAYSCPTQGYPAVTSLELRSPQSPGRQNTTCWCEEAEQ